MWLASLEYEVQQETLPSKGEELTPRKLSSDLHMHKKTHTPAHTDTYPKNLGAGNESLWNFSYVSLCCFDPGMKKYVSFIAGTLKEKV